VDLLITVGDLTNAVEDLTSQGTFLSFSRLLSMFLQATLYVLVGTIHNKRSALMRVQLRHVQVVNKRMMPRLSRAAASEKAYV